MQVRHPRLRAEASYALILWYEPERLERVVQACLRADERRARWHQTWYMTPMIPRPSGPQPYRIAERAATAGGWASPRTPASSPGPITLGPRVPGEARRGQRRLRRQRPTPPWTLIAQKGVTVKCSLGCNVVLGAVSSYEKHPIRQFRSNMASGCAGAARLRSDIFPVGREYAAANALGFSEAQLLRFTRNAIGEAFALPARRRELLAEKAG